MTESLANCRPQEPDTVPDGSISRSGNNWDNLSLAPTKLEELELEDLYEDFQTQIPSGFRFPPVKTLKLNGFAWCNRKEDFDFIWEFSHLLYLSLSEINLVGFLEHVSFNKLGQLQVLRIEGDYRAHEESYLENVRSPLNRLLNTLKFLQRLKISHEVWKNSLKISSFARDGSQLKHLKVGVTAQVEQMDGYLVIVAKHCVYLTSLVLEFDVISIDL